MAILAKDELNSDLCQDLCDPSPSSALPHLFSAMPSAQNKINASPSPTRPLAPASSALGQQAEEGRANEGSQTPAMQKTVSPLLQDMHLRTSMGAGWAAACTGSLDDGPTQASSAPGRQPFLSMPPPQATSAAKRPPPVLHAGGYSAKSSPSAQGTLGVSPSGVPGLETRAHLSEGLTLQSRSQALFSPHSGLRLAP